MKNKVLLWAAGVMAFNMLTSVSYAQKTEKMSAEYNLNNRTLIVEASLQEGKKTFLNIIVSPASIEIDAEEIKENDEVILRTVQTDTSGKINPQIVMPIQTQGKRYVCYLNTSDSQTKYRFSTVSSSDLNSITTKINNASQSEVLNIVKGDIKTCGLGDGNINNADKIAQYIYLQKPNSGYAQQDFLDIYMTAEGISYIQSGDISLAEFIEEYGTYLEKDYAGEYEKLSDTEKNTLEQLFGSNKVTDSFDSAFYDNLFLAKYITAASSVELREYVTEYFTKHNISMSEFNSISNKIKQDEVFSQMYRNKANVSTIEGVVKAFNDEVSAVLKKGQSSTGGGGGTNGGSGGASMTVEGTGSQNTDNNALFKDISGHWAKNQIEKAYKSGIVNGFDDGSFMPDKNVTRAEFAKMIAQSLNIKADGSANVSFLDVSQNDWYNECVSANAQAGIVMGDDSNRFNPQKNITRQDVAVMIERALAYKGIALSTESFGFSDEFAFSEYAVSAINGLAKAQIVNGYDDGTFAPQKTASRAEAVVMIMRMEELISEKTN